MEVVDVVFTQRFRRPARRRRRRRRRSISNSARQHACFSFYSCDNKAERAHAMHLVFVRASHTLAALSACSRQPVEPPRRGRPRPPSLSAAEEDWAARRARRGRRASSSGVEPARGVCGGGSAEGGLPAPRAVAAAAHEVAEYRRLTVSRRSWLSMASSVSASVTCTTRQRCHARVVRPHLRRRDVALEVGEVSTTNTSDRSPGRSLPSLPISSMVVWRRTPPRPIASAPGNLATKCR